MNNRILYLFYFLSGFSALIYEVVWLRKLELVFGTTTHAVSTVLAVFFTGLGVGAWVFGKYEPTKWEVRNGKLDNEVGSEKKQSHISRQNPASHVQSPTSNPLFLYGLLELGIGLYAIATPWIFNIIESVQASFWQTFQPSFSGFSVVTFVLATSGIILPTILMGGTFPVAAKAATLISADIGANPRRAEKHGLVGWLYGLNTLGAVLGVLAAGFFLIPSIGVNETIWIAAGISLIVGGIAIYFANANK